jgi:hypothetical protein
MTTFVAAMYEVADTLAVLDNTVQGFRDRLDQLYDINEKYVRLNKIVSRYIEHDKRIVSTYFTRAGQTVPNFYNEHYPEIMRAITYDLPKLIRDAAAYLAEVYHINT